MSYMTAYGYGSHSTCLEMGIVIWFNTKKKKFTVTSGTYLFTLKYNHNPFLNLKGSDYFTTILRKLGVYYSLVVY